MEQLFDAVGCCSADVYEDREAARFVDGDEDVQTLLPDRCAEVLGLASPEASYMDRRKAYIRAALVFSRLVGPVAPWREKRGFERRGAQSFADVAAAFEGLRATRDAPPGFQPDDFLPQLRCSTDGGRTVDDDRPPVSAMLQVDVRDSGAGDSFELGVKFSTTRFVLTRTLREFRALHASLQRRAPACASALPPLPHSIAEPGDKDRPAGFFEALMTPKGRNSTAASPRRDARRRLRAWVGQAVDWFRARRLYDPELLAFVDLDAELLLRLHREDMRVTRNILVAWGGPATHAVPAPWARSFVDAVASRRGRNVAEPPLPGPIRAREWLEENRTEEDAWRLVTRPAYVVLSAVYGADAELDVGTLKSLVDSQALAPQQTFLGLTVEQE